MLTDGTKSYNLRKHLQTSTQESSFHLFIFKLFLFFYWGIHLFLTVVDLFDSSGTLAFFLLTAMGLSGSCLFSIFFHVPFPLCSQNTHIILSHWCCFSIWNGKGPGLTHLSSLGSGGVQKDVWGFGHQQVDMLQMDKVGEMAELSRMAGMVRAKATLLPG